MKPDLYLEASRQQHGRAARASQILLAALLLSAPLSQASVILQADTHQITSSLGRQITPSLGADNISPLVVYSSSDPIGINAYGPSDVYYQRLQNGAPSGAPVAVTTGSRDDRLNDVSGNHIVYTSFESTASAAGEIRLYQISTGQTSTLATGISLQNFVAWPKIAGNKVVWEAANSLVGMSIQYYDISNPGAGVQTLLGPEIGSFDPFGIGDRLVTWSRTTTTGTNDVYAYDFLTGNITNLTQTAGIVERIPSTSGAWVVYRTQVLGSTDYGIEAYNVDTGERRVIVPNGSLVTNPKIDGNLVTWDQSDGTSPTPNFDVFVYRLDEGDTFQVTMDPAIQYLNDVFGDLVAYVRDQDPSIYSQEDVYVSRLSFVPEPTNGAPEPATLSLIGIGLLGLAARRRRGAGNG